MRRMCVTVILDDSRPFINILHGMNKKSCIYFWVDSSSFYPERTSFLF